jgi:ABC-type sugar transport system ATPase subunit
VERAPIALEMLNISKSFPGVRALDDVSFGCARGEIHALCGENGAGKSTLIKILGGAYRPDRGRILLDGHEVEFSHPVASRRAGVSIIHQELSLLPHRSVAENIFLGIEPTRYGIDARILVMDEPTAALDRDDAARLLDLVKRLSEEGVSVIYVSHRMPEIKTVADRVTVLKDGRTVMTAPIAEAPTGRLVRAMVGRDLADFYPPRAAKPPGAPALVIRGAANDHLINIDLTVRAGEIVGVAGLEGAGKSALGRAIAGDEPFDQGAVEIAGKALTPRSPRSAIEAGIGRLSEDRKREGLLMQQSLRDNATLIQRAFAGPFRAPGADTMSNTETDQRLTQLDVRAASFEQEAGRLSGGNQQKVIVARWLARDPQVLVFSEPTRGIDVAAKAAIYKIMRDLADRGRAILMISSDLPEIVGVSDRIVVMREGHIAGELPGGASEEEVMAIAVAHDSHDSLGAT